MDPILTPVVDQLAAAITWWTLNPGKGLIGVGLLAAVIAAVAVALTVQGNRRRDDQLLDRLGSATPGQPATELDAALLAGRYATEATPIPDLVDTDTAIATIKAGAL